MNDERTLDKKVLDIARIIRSIELQLEALQSQINLGIIEAGSAEEERKMLTQKERTLKELLVSKQHLTHDGLPRAISHHEPTEKYPYDYWITRVDNGHKLKAPTKDNLIDKLYEYYLGEKFDLTIKGVFKAALIEKNITENPKQATIYKNEADFKKYITPAFANRNITTVTEIDIKKYTQELVTRTHLKKQAFLNYKGILNIIFRYAFRHKIITQNPLDYITNRPYLKSCDTSHSKPSEKILSPEEIESLKSEIRHRMTQKKYGEYYIHGYAMLFAIETGVRAGELCALKWEDIKENCIHIHSQQLFENSDEGPKYTLVPYTKNEKGDSQDGRDFPLTRRIVELLREIKEKQEALGINSEFIFCHEDGTWIKTKGYETFLRRLCRSQGLTVTNNHALRMSLNSNVLLPMGISVADRAAMLGHSIQTNLRCYSFAQKDYIENVRDLLDSAYEKSLGTQRTQDNIIKFPYKKSSEALI